MIKRNIHQLHIVSQDTMDGILMNEPTRNDIPKTKLIHSIIREYGKYHDGSYRVNLRELSLSDKRLLLSYFVDHEEWVWSHQSPYNTEALFKENEDYMHEAVEDECFSVYKENMEEMGMCLRRHADNNEPYWVRR